jgi:hypothetical protein
MAERLTSRPRLSVMDVSWVVANAGFVVVLLPAVAAFAVMVWVVRHAVDDPEPRAERYRDRSAMNRRRTPAWWLVRFELAAGIGLTLLVGLLGVDWAMTICFGCNPSAVGPLPLPPNALLAVGAFAIAVAGLAWMVRILRGPRDEPPRWRYRDR